MAKTHPSLYAHIAKWEGLFPRLVLTYYIIDCATKRVYPDGPIAAAYAKRVYRFITEYLFAHAYSFYSDLLAESDQTADAKKIADLILARQWTTVTHRDIKRGDKRFADMPARDLHQTLESLAMMDWVRISGDSRVAVRDGMVKSWDVNPRIHEAFAGRAEESRKRRALSKAKLKALQEARKTE